MINGIKIYNKDGVLKEEISSKKAREIYNETNRAVWDLSPSQRRVWNAFKAEADEGKPYEKTGLRVWIKKKYKKRSAKYKIKCNICKEEAMMMSPGARYCSQKCFGINRRAKDNRKNKDK
jgi:hypothetical protein